MKEELTNEEIEKIDKYFKAANYLSVGQLYLLDNPLLKRPLEAKDIKPNIPGALLNLSLAEIEEFENFFTAEVIEGISVVCIPHSEW